MEFLSVRETDFQEMELEPFKVVGGVLSGMELSEANDVGEKSPLVVIPSKARICFTAQR
jgi:hypothetical protein